MQAIRNSSSWSGQFLLPMLTSNIAKQLNKCSDEEKLLRGENLDAVVAACIFIVSCQAQVPRAFRETCNLTISDKTLGQYYKALERAYNLSPGAHGKAFPASQSLVTGAEDVLVRYCKHTH